MFNVGDRVAVYDNGKRQVGFVGKTEPSAQNIRVDNVSSQQCDKWTFGWFHPKQLRRLKKREKRRVWVLEDNMLTYKLGKMVGFDAMSFKPDAPCVEFVEVRKKK